LFEFSGNRKSVYQAPQSGKLYRLTGNSRISADSGKLYLEFFAFAININGLRKAGKPPFLLEVWFF